LRDLGTRKPQETWPSWAAGSSPQDMCKDSRPMAWGQGPSRWTGPFPSPSLGGRKSASRRPPCTWEGPWRR
jgi:hypothetical protein